MISVIKIGGNIIDDPIQLQRFLKGFGRIAGEKILVHGGGKLATELSSKLGIETRMENGRRITDAESLKVAVMTYAGWINKNIVAGLCSENCPAIGLSGADGNLLVAEKRKAELTDFGFVGDPKSEEVNTDLLMQLMKTGLCPVIAPITQDGKGQLLNTNADTIAGILAAALSNENDVRLIFCFEKNGILEDTSDPSSVIHSINELEAGQLVSSGKINTGMLPKLQAAIKAKKSGVKRVIIGHAESIGELVTASASCTEII